MLQRLDPVSILFLMIKPFILGKKIFPVNLIQGPLAGISSAPFRRLAWRYSQPAFSCTEMISCKTILYQSQLAQQRYMAKALGEGPVCFQLSGSDPAELAEATKRVTDVGADLIDLNCGCPVKKIRSRGAGSSLLMNASTLYQLICAMKENTSVPVSIKIRVEGGSDEKCNSEIAKVVADAGADFLVVHGRHWRENYETPCRYDEVQFFVEQLKIPVIGNGDIACVKSLKRMLATGCAGVMIGRAGVGQPWLIKKLVAEIKQEKFIPPSYQEIGFMFLEHVQGLIALLGTEKLAILQARKFVKYYARGLKNKDKLCTAVNLCETFQELQALTLGFFGGSASI